MEIPVHCLPYGLMRIQSSMFPTSVLTLGNFFFFSFFLEAWGNGDQRWRLFSYHIFSLLSLLAFSLFPFSTLFSSLVYL